MMVVIIGPVAGVERTGFGWRRFQVNAVTKCRDLLICPDIS
jgi:hypothetical protein